MICLQQNYVGKQVIIQMNVIVNSVNTVTNVADLKIKTNRIEEKKSNIKEQEISPALFIISFYKKYLELNYKYILLQ